LLDELRRRAARVLLVEQLARERAHLGLAPQAVDLGTVERVAAGHVQTFWGWKFSIASMAASRAARSSLSDPESSARPQRPTFERWMSSMFAAFSASFTASVTYAAGATSSTSSVRPGTSSAPRLMRLISCAW